MNDLAFKIQKSYCLLFSVVCRFRHFFSHITTVSGCDRELNAHFYSAASLKYQYEYEYEFYLLHKYTLTGLMAI